MLLGNWEKGKFQSQNLPMNISQKNETEAMHKITFRASNSVSGKSVSSFAMTTVTFQKGRK